MEETVVIAVDARSPSWTTAPSDTASFRGWALKVEWREPLLYPLAQSGKQMHM
jgi:hypothetical protein